MTPIEKYKRIESAVTAVKELAVIVTGITITNAIVMLLAEGHFEGIRSAFSIPLSEWALFCIVVFNVARFYHGNLRLLDDSYIIEPRESFAIGKKAGENRANILFLDFAVIFLTSVLFAFMTFYIATRHYLDFFVIFFLILTIDILWYVLTSKDTRDVEAQKQRKKWFLNNVTHVGLMMPLLTAEFIFRSMAEAGDEITVPPGKVFVENYSLLIFAILALTNTVLDYVISWSFYFPFQDPDTQANE